VTTRGLLEAAGHCLCAAALPALSFGLLTAVDAAHPGGAASASLADLLGTVRRVGLLACALWLAAAISWAATRPWRDCRALQRLKQLRDLAAQPDHALVQVQTTIWTTAAGQHAVVLNIATGALHRVWLPETKVPIGAYCVLERTLHGVRVIDLMTDRSVAAAHRHERGRHADGGTSAHTKPARHVEQPDDAAVLIDEVEKYLEQQGSR